jgi:hypothetical protein
MVQQRDCGMVGLMEELHQGVQQLPQNKWKKYGRVSRVFVGQNCSNGTPSWPQHSWAWVTLS